MECGGRAERHTALDSSALAVDRDDGSIQSGVALRFPPHSKGSAEFVCCAIQRRVPSLSVAQMPGFRGDISAAIT